MQEALEKGLGSRPWYEKYVRVFYREIFLDQSVDDSERGFWLCRMISPLPLFHQARLLYMLYGPEDDDDGKRKFYFS